MMSGVTCEVVCKILRQANRVSSTEQILMIRLDAGT
jgi:hypothetical protein